MSGQALRTRDFDVHDGGSESNLVFCYGAESVVPPEDVMAFVKAAVDITEPWCQHAIRCSEDSAQCG